MTQITLFKIHVQKKIVPATCSLLGIGPSLLRIAISSSRLQKHWNKARTFVSLDLSKVSPDGVIQV